MTNATSTDVARREDAQAPAKQGQPQNVLQVFDNAAFKQQVAAALPKHIGVDSMMRIALTEVRMNADLQKCTPQSFMGALLKAAQAGLRPGMFGEGWIIPRYSKKTQSMEASFQPGYMGLAQLAYRSGEVSDILAEAVYPDDHFKYQLGSAPGIEHVPDMQADHDPAKITAFYAVVKLTNGGTLMKVMRRAEVDDIRDRFAPKSGSRVVGPWASDYEAMGKKTVLIQCLKLAPKESERSEALKIALQAENDALFSDRVAGTVVDGHASVADRVAQRIGAEPEPDDEPVVGGDTGEVIDGEAEEEGNVKKLRPDPATKKQLADIDKAYKASGIYEAEFASLLEEYGGDIGALGYGLDHEHAVYVLEALQERAGS